MTGAFAALADEPRWVAWRLETRNGKATKVPYVMTTGGVRRARTDDASMWMTRAAAEAVAVQIMNGHAMGGVGIVLGSLDGDLALLGTDLDTCIDNGTLAPWAAEVVAAFATYTEFSPSRTGVKAYALLAVTDLPALRAAMRTEHGKQFRRSGGEHPPAIELHCSNRYFAVTDEALPGTPAELRHISLATALWVINEAGPRFAGTGKAGRGRDNSRSAKAYRIALALRRRDPAATLDQVIAVLEADPDTAAWLREKGEANGGRELQRLWARICAQTTGEVTMADFVAYLPDHKFIFRPTRQLWTPAGVNHRLPPVSIGTDEKGREKFISAAAQIARDAPVEQMVWAPGERELIQGRLLNDGGWIERPGVTAYNLYRPAIIIPRPGDARPWTNHVQKLYGGEARHLIHYFAHRVQRPAEKPNHGVVMGGAPGIGKDSALEPVKQAVGPWNFLDVTPRQILGRFNGHLRTVVLRINEIRDLGERDRYVFYDHSKIFLAAPPDVLRIDEKNIREYMIPNICGVIIGTNHRTGIYLPADDRRHYFCWSERMKEDFAPDYFARLYAWYDAGGYEIVANYLGQLDISTFDPKIPPPQTEAFWAAVNATASPESAEMADRLEALGSPVVVTLDQIKVGANPDFMLWLLDRRNYRAILYRLEDCGYEAVRNRDAKDGLWRISDKRQVVYGRRDVPLSERLEAVRGLA
jgi:hypothetical protein